jgi:intracellular septation protein A
MKRILSEKNIVVILFVMVFITFSLAQEDSKKMEKKSTDVTAVAGSHLMVHQSLIKKVEIELAGNPK